MGFNVGTLYVGGALIPIYIVANERGEMIAFRILIYYN